MMHFTLLFFVFILCSTSAAMDPDYYQNLEDYFCGHQGNLRDQKRDQKNARPWAFVIETSKEATPKRLRKNN